MNDFFNKVIQFLKIGRCKYCLNKNLFGKPHKECLKKYDDGWREMVTLAANAAKNGDLSDNLKNNLDKIAKLSFIENYQLKDVVVKGWEQATEGVMEENILSDKDESNLMGFAKHHSLSQYDLDNKGLYTRAIQSCVLRDIVSGGNFVSRFKTDVPIPFNLQKMEKLIWIFQNTQYFEEKTRR
jgi:hypothetical protein